MQESANPVLVEVTRGAAAESRHRGSAIVVDSRGHVLGRWGDVERPIYPRSAVKPLQALALVETGAADAFGVGEDELALACASHKGQPIHTERVARWLARIGCGPADLECGAHVPNSHDAAAGLIRSGQPPTALHNNCSGKHTGFLTTARHLGEPTAGYVGFGHPVQQRLLGILEQMTGQPLAAAPPGIDGCSIPTIAIPLYGLAFAMARLARPDELPERRAQAAARIVGAWGRWPELIGGAGSFDTAIIGATAGRVVTKTGAEGVHCAAIPAAGIGIALKIDDGAGRAADVAMAALLRAYDALDGEAATRLADVIQPPVLTRRGVVAGVIRPAAGFPQ